MQAGVFSQHIFSTHIFKNKPTVYINKNYIYICMVCMYVYTIYNQGEDLNLNEGAPGDTNSTLRTTGIYIHMDTVNFSKNVVQKASE
jgi:hypothetical protein